MMYQANDRFKPKAKQIYIGDFQINRMLNQISHNGNIETLEPKAIELLFYLADEPHQVRSREEIRRAVWGNVEVSDHAINRLISLLRKSLGDVEQPYRIIETIAKRGYRLIVEVSHTHSQFKVPKVFTVILIALPFVIAIAHYLLKTSPLATFKPIGAVTEVTAMPAREWHAQYAMDDRWISYLHRDENSTGTQLYIQQVNDEIPHALLSDNLEVSTYTWLGETNQVVLATFDNAQCTLKQYTFDQHKRILTPQHTLLDCGNKPIRQLTYSSFNQNLYWVSRDYGVLDRQGKMNSYSLADNKPQLSQKAVPDVSNIYRLEASPDGTQLALLRQYQWEHSEIYLYDIAAQKLQKLYWSDSFIQSLSWARQGRALFYVSDNQFKLHDLSSKTKTLRFSSENRIQDASFSATNEQFLYVSDTGRYQMQELSLDNTGELTKASWGSAQNERNPVFANDGLRLAYISKRSGQYRIWITTPDGESFALKTDDLDLYQTLVRWSADDNFILFHSKNALFQYDLEQHTYEQLTPDDLYADVVGWSFRDPKHLYLRSDKDGQFNIWRLNTLDKTMNKITRNGGFSGNESRDGRYFYYTREKQDGLWRMDLASGEEVLLHPHFHRGNYLSWFVYEDGIYYLMGDDGPGLYWWQFDDDSHTKIWQMATHHHGGFAVSRRLNKAFFGIKPLGQWDIMQLKGSRLKNVSL